MDSVRFGRALGFGARVAAKTLVTAVDAATAPNPASRAPGDARKGREDQEDQGAVRQPTPQGAAGTTSRAAARAANEVRGTTAGIARGSRRFGEAVWGPFTRLSGVLWLELTGVFFGLFALSAAVGAWKLRDALAHGTADSGAQTHLALAVAIALVFTYFSISSFVRARRREHRR